MERAVTRIIEQMRDWPWLWAWAGFFVIVSLRAGGTYLIGRGVGAGVIRARPPAARTRAAMERVGRWGAPAVTLSFLTVGVQTVINLAAGLIAMPVIRYLAALALGAAVWATIWSTIGMAAFYAVLGGLRGELLTVLVAVAVLAVMAAGYVLLRRRRRDV